VWTVSKKQKQKEEIEEKRLEYRKQERRLLGWCCVSPGCVGIFIERKADLCSVPLFDPFPLYTIHYLFISI
jgi:hypothetical protein